MGVPVRRGQLPQVIVVGAGGAGLYAALSAARDGARVTLVSAAPLAEASSFWAQGGIAAAIAPDDSPEAHLRDTVAAGRQLVRESAARLLVAEAPHVVADLARLGVMFDADRHGHFALGLEGGHQARRVVHAGGAATGRRIVRQLSALVAEHPRITVLEGTPVTAILTCDGRAVGVEVRGGDRSHAPAVILATGGAAALWSRTTNPGGATGGGMLLAHRAGAKLADLELMQFHPTALVAPGPHDGYLVTEAIRGEGARLLNAAGERFVDELAPRDEVARAIFDELVRSDQRWVSLDMREVDPGLFPNVVAALREFGTDPETSLVPVAPAAHYMMGGIATDLDGRTSLAGLYAVGECACTGLHGANRLASNSLTECFVFGGRAGRCALAESALSPGLINRSASTSTGRPPQLTQASREALWHSAGLRRSAEGLESLLEDPHPLVALIARAALHRQESRGAHRRDDFPDRDPALDNHHVVLRSGQEPVFERWS